MSPAQLPLYIQDSGTHCYEGVLKEMRNEDHMGMGW